MYECSLSKKTFYKQQSKCSTLRKTQEVVITGEVGSKRRLKRDQVSYVVRLAGYENFRPTV